MSAVLREIVAKLGFEVNSAGFKRANDGIERIKRSVQTFDVRLRASQGRASAFGQSAGSGMAVATRGVQGLSASVSNLQSMLLKLGLGFGFGSLIKQMVTLASDANETDNVLEQVFGAEGAARVKGWAASTSKEIGRSRYTLREYAGQLGAMLEPMVGSASKAQEMSTTFAKLSVDLASFFNTADDDALAALKSGLAGETEPLRRYGIVLLDATLQEYAHTQGIHKKITAMSNAEKVELRYRYILAHTTKAQGDAARTADGFANSSRALKDNLKDLGTTLGQRLLPYAGQLIRWGNQAIRVFKDFADTSNILEGVLLTLGGAFLAMNAGAIAGLAVPLALLIGFAMALDEIKTLLDGGTSRIGIWLDKWKGIGTADKLVREFRELLEDFDKHMPDFLGAWDLWAHKIDNVAKRVQALAEVIAKLPIKFLDTVTFNAAIRKARGGQDAAEGRTAARGVQNTTMSLEEDIATGDREAFDIIRADVAKRAQDRADRARAEHMYPNSPLRPEFQGPGDLPGFTDRLQQSYGVLRPRDDVQFGRARVPVPVSARPAAAAGATTNVTVNNGPVTVNAGSQSDARASKQAIERERRKTKDELERQGAR
jgi:hypothetical protein